MGEHAVQGRLSRVVEEADCATRWGNDGLYVLSTPAILGHMEQACVHALSPTLQDGEMSVGVSVRLSHLAPTPLGDTVTYEVSLSRERRRVDVDFVVTNSRGTVVSEGSHERAVIDKARFLDRLARG